MTAFQDNAERCLRAVLAKHSIHIEFTSTSGKDPIRSGSFETSRGKYEITITDDIAMTRGDDEELFECFLPREYEDDQVLMESFARRLDRYLSGGPWEEPDEKEPGPIARFFQRVLDRS